MKIYSNKNPGINTYQDDVYNILRKFIGKDLWISVSIHYPSDVIPERYWINILSCEVLNENIGYYHEFCRFMYKVRKVYDDKWYARQANEDYFQRWYEIPSLYIMKITEPIEVLTTEELFEHLDID